MYRHVHWKQSIWSYLQLKMWCSSALKSVYAQCNMEWKRVQVHTYAYSYIYICSYIKLHTKNQFVTFNKPYNTLNKHHIMNTVIYSITAHHHDYLYEFVCKICCRSYTPKSICSSVAEEVYSQLWSGRHPCHSDFRPSPDLAIFESWSHQSRRGHSGDVCNPVRLRKGRKKFVQASHCGHIINFIGS